MTDNKSFSFFTDMIDYTVIETKGEKRYYVTGYISTKDIDLYNDIVTENGMKSMLKQLSEESIKLDFEHEQWRDDSSILPVGKIVEAKIDEKGLWVKAELNDASPKFDSLWKSIKKGFVDAFSIAFTPIKTMMKNIKEGVTARLIDDLKLLNVAVTSVPVNKACKMDKVFTKALSEMEDDKMSEEKETKEEAPEEPKEEPKQEVKEEPQEDPQPEEKPEEESEEPETKDIDLKALEDNIVRRVTEALEKKMVFKSMPQDEPEAKDDLEIKSILSTI